MNLTRREEQVLRALAEGLTYKEIADAMEISMNTARTHVKSIYVKLGVRSRTAAAVRWLDMGDRLSKRRPSNRRAR